MTTQFNRNNDVHTPERQRGVTGSAGEKTPPAAAFVSATKPATDLAAALKSSRLSLASKQQRRFMRATDAVDLPVDRKSGTAMAKLPPRFAKGASQLSLNTKQKIRARPQEYAYSAAASFQEITRLISLNDEQKLYIQKLHSDMKTLKIVCASKADDRSTPDRNGPSSLSTRTRWSFPRCSRPCRRS